MLLCPFFSACELWHRLARTHGEMAQMDRGLAFISSSVIWQGV